MVNLFERIVSFYLSSQEFNGLPVYKRDEIDLGLVAELVRDGLVQVVSEEDFLNPHIRPWTSNRSIDDQITSLYKIKQDEYMVALYPTAKAMKDWDIGETYKGRPYHRRMAEGKGSLELAYFRYDVLEPYRNDPRFNFAFSDYGVDIWLHDDLYLDDTEADADKTAIDHVGFAYDLSDFDENDPDSEIRRLVCAFYIDLCKLNTAHQLRWSTYEVEEKVDIEPHPIWWGGQMGHWPDGTGPFERFFFELETFNTLFKNAHGENVLNITSRPDAFGWILRPSQTEFDTFVHQLDKLMSDNLRHKAFDRIGVDRLNAEGGLYGTITRLDLTLAQYKMPEGIRKSVLKPFRDVRRLRQKPAHTLVKNITKSTFVHHQATLLCQATDSLEQLRRFWQSHPMNKDWKEPEFAAVGAHSYWL